MNKKDYLLFAVLLALLFAWPAIDRIIAQKFFPDRLPSSAQPRRGSTETGSVASAKEGERTVLVARESDGSPVLTAVEEGDTSLAEGEKVETAPEEFIVLTNRRATFVFSNRGAALTKATLHEYRASLQKESGPVTLDFSRRPALALEGWSAFGEEAVFRYETSADGGSVRFSKEAPGGLQFERVIEIGDSYVLKIVDRLKNTRAEPAAVPAVKIRTGPMMREPGRHDAAGVISLGVDTLSPGGEGVQHWSGKLDKFFKAEMERREMPGLPITVYAPPREHPVDWVAAKNKYFVQILTPPEGSGERGWIYARRAPAPRELSDPTFISRKMTEIVEVGAAVELGTLHLEPGQLFERQFTLYVGPMKYSELHAMRLHQEDVMEFGMWAPIGKVLLRVLNFLHDHVPPHNYGIAIILLTVIVRAVFWPITHKSTQSMKRMAEVSPLVNQIREKYKDNPQKMQQEIMAIYKEHKINPLSGCLPMLIQIPVFIALFVVLRSAIELRFASFLWISDLSEPENLFPGLLPFGLPLNILPILMALTMYLQMKLSPSTGDPVQQKIMAVLMPAMMLIFLYNFASGLALYWTTQNVLMIVQQLLMRRKLTHAPVPTKKA